MEKYKSLINKLEERFKIVSKSEDCIIAEAENYEDIDLPYFSCLKKLAEAENLIMHPTRSEDSLQLVFQPVRIHSSKYLSEYKKPRRDYTCEIEYQINALNLKFKYLFDIDLFKNISGLSNISKTCNNEDEFISRISLLANIIDGVNGKEIKNKFKLEKKCFRKIILVRITLLVSKLLNVSLSKKGLEELIMTTKSIEILETFLENKYPNYNRNIIKNMRDIKALRNQCVHTKGKEYIKILKKYGFSPPLKDNEWILLWEKCLDKFLESLRELNEIIKT